MKRSYWSRRYDGWFPALVARFSISTILVALLRRWILRKDQRIYLWVTVGPTEDGTLTLLVRSDDNNKKIVFCPEGQPMEGPFFELAPGQFMYLVGGERSGSCAVADFPEPDWPTIYREDS